MDSHKFWNNLTMYNENVLRWCGSMYEEDIDILVDENDEIIVYDDTDEWYNIYESEADD
jgi:hypothetical protein